MGKDSVVSVPYQLYYNSFSICSLMTLLTFRRKGEPSSPDLAVDPITEEIDIYTGDQNKEEFLEKNWKGQVSGTGTEGDAKTKKNQHLG